jgi:hypothetical protein
MSSMVGWHSRGMHARPGQGHAPSGSRGAGTGGRQWETAGDGNPSTDEGMAGERLGLLAHQHHQDGVEYDRQANPEAGTALPGVTQSTPPAVDVDKLFTKLSW